MHPLKVHNSLATDSNDTAVDKTPEKGLKKILKIMYEFKDDTNRR